MAEGDQKYVPVVTPVQKQGQVPDLQALNETIRQAFMNIYKMEGRSGESVIRDDLKVMGKLTFTAKSEEPDLSITDEAVIYLDEDGGLWVSIDTDEYRPLLGSLNIVDVGIVSDVWFDDTYFSVTPDGTSATVSLLVAPVDQVDYGEEFIGDGGWGATYTGTGSAGTLSVATITASELVGIRSIQTGATVNSSAALHPGPTATTTIARLTGIGGLWMACGTQGTSDMRVLVGIGKDISDTNFGTDGLYFCYDSSVDGFWHVIGRVGGVNEDFDTGVAYAGDQNNDFLIDLSISGEVDIIFWLNGTPIGAIGSIPTITDGYTIGMRIENLTGSNKVGWIDWVRILSTTAR